MDINYLEFEYNSRSLFVDERYFEINFIPEKILHREEELVLLSKLFIRLLEYPFSISRKVLIQGNVGLGKTLICQIFGKMLMKSASIRSLNIQYVHVNCRKEKTPYQVLFFILRSLNCSIPRRGFSPQELLSILEEYLTKNNLYLVIVLDEINYLDVRKFNLIYSLSRLNESSLSGINYISIIAIVRDISLLDHLDPSTLSTLQGNILRIKKYKKTQIFDILKYRVEKGIKNGVFPDELIEFISDRIYSSGDIRKGLNIIRNAVKIAEIKKHSIVDYDDLMESFDNLIPSLQDDGLQSLTFHQKILLHSIAESLVSLGENFVEIRHFRDAYEENCRQRGVTPWKNTQLWENLRFLKKMNLIEIEIVSKNVRGRKSRISINSVPPSLLLKELSTKL